MHRALYLPEIIAEIVRSEISSLYTCLFINKAFSFEATRVLWEACGARNYGITHIKPDIKHLVRIIQKDPQRGQFYANFIHILMFHDEGESHYFLDEARWHKELASVKFSNLQEVDLYESQNATKLNTGDAVIRYIQPNVKDFTFRQGSRLSNHFLDVLSKTCPKLESLTLNQIRNNSVSEDALVRFLHHTDSLQCLDIRTGLDESWSYKAFDVITTYRNLSLLASPDIPNQWVDSLRNANPTRMSMAFPKLKHFYTGISEQGLESLAHYMPNLETLSIGLQHLPPSHHILASASNFTRLISLTVHFGRQSTVSGHDLMLVAQKCPEIIELSFGDGDGCCPGASGITDDTIDEVAQKMPKMIDLTLVFDHPNHLTWRSLHSIARHCKNLEVLQLSCNFSWQDVINGIPKNTFPTLRALGLIFDKDNRDGQGLDYSEESFESFAGKFVMLAPKLTHIEVEGGNEADRALVDSIYHSCMMRD